MAKCTENVGQRWAHSRCFIKRCSSRAAGAGRRRCRLDQPCPHREETSGSEGETPSPAGCAPASRPKVAGLAAEFPENWFRMLPTSGPNVCSAHSREGPPGRLKPHTARHPPPAAACQAAARSQPRAKRREPGAGAQGRPHRPGPPGGGPHAIWRLLGGLQHRGSPSVARSGTGAAGWRALSWKEAPSPVPGAPRIRKCVVPKPELFLKFSIRHADVLFMGDVPSQREELCI